MIGCQLQSVIGPILGYPITGEGCKRNRSVCSCAFAAAGVRCIAVFPNHAAFEHGEELFEARQGACHDGDMRGDCSHDCDSDARVY